MRAAPVSATTTTAAADPSARSHDADLSNPYPVNLLLAGRRCLVVGAGPVGAHKARGLVAADADVTVVAPEVTDAVRQLPVAVHVRPYRRGEVASYRLAITATDDPEVNAQVFRDAEAAGVWVNSADDPDRCAFTLPAVARSGDLQVTVSTAGRSPALASWLRRRFEAEFDHAYTALLELLSTTRETARAHHGTSELRGWTAALDAGALDLVRAGDLEGARSLLHHHLDLPEASS